MPFTYDYPRPMVTTDILLFSGKNEDIKILLILRGRAPFEGCWALPGGFLEMQEELIDCAKRELLEETGLHGIDLHELFTVGTIGRDLRGRVITVMFYGLLDEKEKIALAGDDAAAVKWFKVNELPEMSFDHLSVINKACRQLFNIP